MPLVSPRNFVFNGGFNLSPHASESLARPSSPFTDSRTPPRSPKHTEQIWDEYERIALEKVGSGETSLIRNHPGPFDAQRFSSGTVTDIIKSYHGDSCSSPKAPVSSPVFSTTASPRLDFTFPPSTVKKTTSEAFSSTKTICKGCKRPTSLISGPCEECKNLATRNTENSSSPLRSAQRNFASTDLSNLHKHHKASTSHGNQSPQPPRSPSSRPHSSDTALLNSFPVRLSSLRPIEPAAQPLIPSTPPPRKKISLTDPHDASIHITRKLLPPAPAASASSFTDPLALFPSTPPAAAPAPGSGSTASRPGAGTPLANITTPPTYTHAHIHTSRATSAAPSVGNSISMYPYIYPYSSTETTPVQRTSWCR